MDIQRLKIKTIAKHNKENTYSIHYSCNKFYNGGAIAPTICSITIVNIYTKDLHTFALHNYIIQGKSLMESEQLLLNDFVNFFKTLSNPLFIHWSMDSLAYGFKAIYARAENFGIYDFNLSKIKDINLSNALDYSLIKSLEKNNCKSITVMNGNLEAECFEKRNYNLIKLSTEGKALGIAELFEKYISEDLIDDYNEDDDY